jgi:hypothetical protein
MVDQKRNYDADEVRQLIDHLAARSTGEVARYFSPSLAEQYRSAADPAH